MRPTLPRAVALAALCAFAALASACDRDKDKDTKRSEPAQSAEAQGTSEETQAPAEPVMALGLPAHCSFERAAGGGSFICKPRELPITKYTEAPDTFDAAAACKHDDGKISCDLGAGGAAFVFDFSNETKEEQIYGRLPLMLAAAKLLLANKFEDEPAKKELIYAALDLVETHRYAFFTLGDVKPALDQLAALVKKNKPDLPDAKIEACKASILAVVEEMRARKLAGELQDADMVTLVGAFVTNLPPELQAGVGTIDIDQLITILEATGQLGAALALKGQ